MAAASVQNGASELYPAITKSRISVIVAGMGDKGRDTCGQVTWMGVCENDGGEGGKDGHDRILKHSRCYRLSCPECYTQGAARAVRRASSRLLGGKELYKIKHNPRHIIFSAPQEARDLTDSDQWDAVFNELYAILKLYAIGSYGGCCVLHPYRISSAGKQEYAEEDRELSLWQWIISTGREEFLDDSVHIHTMMYGWLPPADEFFKLTGWVYKVMGGDHQDPALQYMISHAGLYIDTFEDEYGDRKQLNRKQAIRWFGEFSPGKIVYDGGKEVVRGTVLCSKCGGVLYKHWHSEHQSEFRPLLDWDGEKIPVSKVEIYYRYKLKNKRSKARSRQLVLSEFG